MNAYSIHYSHIYRQATFILEIGKVDFSWEISLQRDNMNHNISQYTVIFQFANEIGGISN